MILMPVSGLLAGCASPPPEPLQPLSSELVVATSELPQQQLLDIGLIVFEPGLPEGQPGPNPAPVYTGVRQAEARYLPYVLRQTLEASGQWGAVRVLPEADPSAELLISGTILQSDGVELTLQIRAWDASGREWLNKVYIDVADWPYYRDRPVYTSDPFVDLYNSVANDLNEARAQLSPAALQRIIDISQLRYAAALSPQAFSGYLVTQDDGTVRLSRLPALNDPMVARLERLRQSEYLFIDALDQQYAAFYREMGPTYTLWRRYSYGQTRELEELRQSARRGSRGFAAMKQSYDTYREAKIQQQALKELAESFNTEVQPTVMDLQGKVVELSGTVAAQYTDWRRLLQAIYQEETGLPLE